MPTSSATLIGCGAIVLWALLATLTAATGEVPPFQLAAMTFLVGGGMGVASFAFRPGAARALRQPPAVWLVGVGGLFGYHALYFSALRLAPPAEAPAAGVEVRVRLVRERLHRFDARSERRVE